ncbi:MAG: hypothetical protein HFH55_03930 [Lachnospiraceae bacterium]|nr:hypothetical protein [Lachnospiraceae bacterium]
MIAKHPKASFRIYSNDKGYQRTVDFWKDRGIEITQKRFATSKKKDQKMPDCAPPSPNIIRHGAAPPAGRAWPPCC